MTLASQVGQTKAAAIMDAKKKEYYEAKGGEGAKIKCYLNNTESGSISTTEFAQSKQWKSRSREQHPLVTAPEQPTTIRHMESAMQGAVMVVEIRNEKVGSKIEMEYRFERSDTIDKRYKKTIDEEVKEMKDEQRSVIEMALVDKYKKAVYMKAEYHTEFPNEKVTEVCATLGITPARIVTGQIYMGLHLAHAAAPGKPSPDQFYCMMIINMNNDLSGSDITSIANAGRKYGLTEVKMMKDMRGYIEGYYHRLSEADADGSKASLVPGPDTGRYFGDYQHYNAKIKHQLSSRGGGGGGGGGGVPSF